MTSANSSTIVFALTGPISPGDIRWMCERIRFLLASSDSRRIVCYVGAVPEPDAATIDALARMQLTARRHGGSMELRRACGELRDLLTLSGLTDVLPCDELRPETRGQAEEREPSRGVEEERDPADPIA